MTGVRTLLWDADGVLQHGPIGWNWRRELDRVGGPGFAAAVFEVERPALTGHERLEDSLARVVAQFPGVPLSVEDLLGLWEMASVDEQAFAYVTELRGRGIPCALASNQQDHRRAWMRDEWGYDTHFDHVFYSSELGVAKPDPRFFTTILEQLEAAPEEVGFIDDSGPNIDSARSVGIATYHHLPRSGIAAMRSGVEALLAGGSTS